MSNVQSDYLNEHVDKWIAISRTSSSMELNEINNASTLSRRKSSNSQDLSKEELIMKLKEYRKANIELLEDKRHLLLRSQEAYKIEVKTFFRNL